MIYTASFFTPENHHGVLISVAQAIPAQGPDCDLSLESFQPPWTLIMDLKNGSVTWEEYVDRYIRQLEENDIKEEFDVVKPYSEEGIDCTLLCWEKTPAKCHRRLLGEWFEQQGLNVTIG